MVRSLPAGDALGFALRYITSEVHGARPGTSKAVVVLVMGVSTDSVAIAANAARSNRKCPACSPEAAQTARGSEVGGCFSRASWLIEMPSTHKGLGFKQQETVQSLCCWETKQ